MDRLGGGIWLIALYFLVPIFIAKIPFGASWSAVGIAYAIWFGLLALFGVSVLASGTVGEAFGWPLIMGMFFTIPAIFVLIPTLRLFGVR